MSNSREQAYYAERQYFTPKVDNIGHHMRTYTPFQSINNSQIIINTSQTPDNSFIKDSSIFIEKSPNGSRMIPKDQYKPYEWKKCSIPECQTKISVNGLNICENCMQNQQKNLLDMTQNLQVLNNMSYELPYTSLNSITNNTSRELDTPQTTIAFKIIEQLDENRKKSEENINKKSGILKEITEIDQNSKVCIIKGCNQSRLETDDCIYSFCSRNCAKKAAHK